MDLNYGQNFNCLAWILNNNIVNENGFPLEIRKHKFLIAPYMDETPRQVVMKAAQVGWSTLAILRSFHLAKYKKANIIYTLPSRSIVKDFVTPKVDPLISNNPKIKDMISVDSMGLKQIDDRFIYFRGSWEESSAIAISAHILISDEVDRSNQLALRTYRTRLDASRMHRPDLGWEWKFSNPSIPGDGVDVWWQDSDQKHWFIQCQRCNYRQYMSFPDSINFESKQFICKKCQRTLSPEDRMQGEWVKRRLGSQISGYWLNQLMLSWIPAEKIIEESLGDQQVFYNFTLGLPYISKEKAVTKNDILGCIVDEENPRTDVAIGVDVGKVKHYVIGNRFGIFRVGTTTSWEEIEDLRNQYNAYMVIDAMPNPDDPIKLATKYRGKVFIHYYKEDSKQIGTVQWGEGDRYGIVYSDRTKIFDNLVADIQNEDIAYNLTEFDLNEYIFHWQQMFRVIRNQTNKDGANTGVVKSEWLTIGGRPDHYPHATVYWKIAMLKTLSQGAIVQPKQPSKVKESLLITDNKTIIPNLDPDKILADMRKHAKQKDWRYS